MNEEFSADELLSRSATEVVRVLDESEAGAASKLLKILEDRTIAAISGFNDKNREAVDHLTTILMRVRNVLNIESRIKILGDACFYYKQIGRAFDGMPRGLAAKKLAEKHGLTDLERRSCIALGAAYGDGACFQEACEAFERGLVLARELHEPLYECSAITNAAALLKDMGLYQDAIEVTDRALAFNIASPSGRYLSFANAIHGLFSAHRLRDDEAALRYLRIGCGMLDDNPLADIVLKNTFEYVRCMYLLFKHDNETAELLIVSARERAANVHNPRVEILLDIASALCEWASREPEREARARKHLRELYHKSKQTHLYHDDVLRALIEVHNRTMTGESENLRKNARYPDDFGADIDTLMRLITETANTGMKYAKELVEYTTGVKQAKFYRQMNDKGAVLEAMDEQEPAPFDPFASVRRWLADDSVAAPAAPAAVTTLPIESPANGTDSKGKDDIRKHDELTAIHGDLAKLRIASLKATIRTAAYDVAENWALAAEFFDDQTGQHCFRVGRLAGMLAAEIGMDHEYCVRIDHAARLHDIGKIAINEMVLLKPGPLDSSELTAMQAHTEVGAQLLEGATDPTLQMATMIAKYHHAWWNGAGYPGTSGERIPLAARICALADVYDALTNVRPYKRAWSHRMAIEQMMCENGAHFDPRLMRPFLKVLERHVGSTAQPPSTQLHLKDMEANGLLTSRRKLMMAVKAG